MLALASDGDGSFDSRRFLPLADFLRQQQPPSVIKLAGVEPTPRAADWRHAWHAVGRFRDFLGRQPLVADLTSDAIERCAAWLVGRGRRPSTANRIAQELVRLGSVAARDGILEVAPSFTKLPADCRHRRALTIGQFERLLAAASERKGEIAGLPAGLWFSAFLWTIANTGLSAATLLSLPSEALTLRRAVGRGGRRRQLEHASLRAEGLVFGLHRHTAGALERLLGSPRARLFPWPGSAKKPTEMALWYFHRLCRRASVPIQKYGAFERVAAIVEDRGVGALDQIDPTKIERDRQALAEQAREAERHRREGTDQPPSHQARVPSFFRLPKKTRDIYFIGNDGPRSLRTFFRNVYAPLRLAGRKEKTLVQFEVALNVAASYVGAEVTLDQLGADWLEGLLAWLVRSGRSPARANGIRASLLALWRLAIRKKYLPFTGEPEMVEKLRLPKREPRTWTIDQFERILAAASLAPGDFYGVPTAKLMPAILLTLYATGLRIGALLQLRTSDLDLQSGWLTVDASYQKHAMDQRWRLPAQCLEAIIATAPGDRLMLFCGPPPGSPSGALNVRGNGLRGRLKEILRTVELPAGSRNMFHAIRRLSATQMAAVAGETAAQWHLGHSDIGLLRRYYLDRSQLARPEAAELLPRLNWTPPASSSSPPPSPENP